MKLKSKHEETAGLWSSGSQHQELVRVYTGSHLRPSKSEVLPPKRSDVF